MHLDDNTFSHVISITAKGQLAREVRAHLKPTAGNTSEQHRHLLGYDRPHILIRLFALSTACHW